VIRGFLILIRGSIGGSLGYGGRYISPPKYSKEAIANGLSS
jgi:hypothetical protein